MAMKIKISYPVYVLIIIIEECAEVIHRACKAIRFGLEERYHADGPNNRDVLQSEINDLVGAIYLAKKHGVLSGQSLHEEALAAHKKINKVEKFSAYSRDVCKTLIETDGLEENGTACYQTFKETLQSEARS
jgi:LPS O-antigen subunit length determinant protein (WzzB/FepE family)